NLGGAVDTVTYSVFSRLQDDPESMKNTMGRTIRVNAFVVMPMLAGLAICAPDLVRIILTEKWLPSVLFLRIFCFVYAIELVTNTNMNSIRAQGRSDLFLKIVLAKQVVDISSIFITMWINIAALACSLIFSNFVYWVLSCYWVNKLFAFPIRKQIMNFLPSVLLSLAMSVPVVVISFLSINTIIRLLLQITSGMITYILLAKITKPEGYIYCAEFVEKFMKKLPVSFGLHKTKQ
ncbi:MAG: hypothetical protein EOM76_12620, partial [Sphingobacteriia bacterium]|nr:hypothetical protein [Sphingobacteriia bacterium]